MTTPSIQSLGAHLQLAGDKGDVPPGWEATLAERLREQLRAHDSDLKPTSAALRDAVQRLMRALEPSARAELLGTSVPAHSEVKMAYRLGQLELAHLVIAQSASRRTDDEFRRTLENPTYRRYIQEMYYEDKSTSELAKVGQRTNEQTSRTLSILRKAGVADFRKVSVQVFNFLTPAAHHAFKKILEREQYKLTAERSGDSGRAAHAAIMGVFQKLDQIERVTPTFGPVTASDKVLFT